MSGMACSFVKPACLFLGFHHPPGLDKFISWGLFYFFFFTVDFRLTWPLCARPFLLHFVKCTPYTSGSSPLSHTESYNKGNYTILATHNKGRDCSRTAYNANIVESIMDCILHFGGNLLEITLLYVEITS